MLRACRTQGAGRRRFSLRHGSFPIFRAFDRHIRHRGRAHSDPAGGPLRAALLHPSAKLWRRIPRQHAPALFLAYRRYAGAVRALRDVGAAELDGARRAAERAGGFPFGPGWKRQRALQPGLSREDEARRAGRVFYRADAMGHRGLTSPSGGRIHGHGDDRLRGFDELRRHEEQMHRESGSQSNVSRLPFYVMYVHITNITCIFCGLCSSFNRLCMK